MESKKSLFVLALASACCVFAFPVRAQGPIRTSGPASTHLKIPVSEVFHGTSPEGKGKSLDSALNRQKNRMIIPLRSEITDTSFNFMGSLPNFPDSDVRSKKHRNKWSDENSRRIIEEWEAHAVTIECVLRKSNKEGRENCNGNDPYFKDYHLSLVNSIGDTAASSSVVAERSPRWWLKYDDLTKVSGKELAKKRIRITGWLMWDNEHPEAVGKYRATQWEIHPVTRVQFWDERSGDWEDLSKELGDLVDAAG